MSGEILNHAWIFVQTLRAKSTVLWLSILLTLPNCSRTLSVKTPPDSLVVGVSTSSKILNPLKATSALDMRLVGLTHQSLVKVGSNLKPMPDAAISWSYKDKTYVFYLAPNLKFSDGSPITPKDILFSFESFQSPKCVFHSAFKIIKKVSVAKVGRNLVVTLKLSQNSPKFLLADLPVIKILKKPLTHELSKKNVLQTSLGSGSYKLEIKKEKSILFSKNPYALNAGTMPKLLFKVVSDDLTRYQQFITGYLDIVMNDWSPVKFQSLQKDKKFKTYETSGLSISYILLNLKNKFLKQQHLRQQLARSIDKTSIIKYKLKNYAEEALTLLNPRHPFFNHHLKPYKPLSKKNIQKSGDKVHLELKVSNNQFIIDYARVLKNQMATTSGADISLKSFEWGTFYKDLKTGNFDMAILSWVGVLDPDIYRIAFYSDEWPPGRNRGYYSRPEMDRLLDEGARVMTFIKRKRIYDKVQEWIHKDVAIIPLWHQKQLIATQKNILNFTPSITGDFLSLLTVEKVLGEKTELYR